MFGNLFKSKNTEKERIYNIEINDEIINKNMGNILLKLQEEVNLLKRHLNYSSIQTNNDLSKIYEKVMLVRRDMNTLLEDVDKIINIEMDNKDYFIIKDDVFLLDKKEQLETIKKLTDNFLQIIEQKPDVNDLRNNLFNQIQIALNEIGEAINKIIKDDAGLRVIYKTLSSI